LGPDGSGFRGVLSRSSHEDGTSHGFCPVASLPVLVLDKILPFGILSVYDFVMTSSTLAARLNLGGVSLRHPVVTCPRSCLNWERALVEWALICFLKGYPVVSVDINPLACTHLERNSHGTVLRMDLTHPSSAKLIHQQVGESPGTVTFGFPCQPFSSQGLMLGSSDIRFEVFKSGLQIIYMTQPQSAILECVPADVVQSLQQLADLTNWTVQTVHLDLKDQWPCRRARWWALLFPKEGEQCQLAPWPLDSPF
jgi:hypothetical protein